MKPITVVLIPGFFGFTNFGRLVYFSHVKVALERVASQQLGRSVGAVLGVGEGTDARQTAEAPVRRLVQNQVAQHGHAHDHFG